VSLCAAGEPVFQAVCHCNECKKRTGSAFGVNAYFRREAVTRIEGETNAYASGSSATNAGVRHFCGKCGTTLFWDASSLPALIGIAGGCFADAPLAEATVTASHSKKWEWVEIPSAWHVHPE